MDILEQRYQILRRIIRIFVWAVVVVLVVWVVSKNLVLGGTMTVVHDPVKGSPQVTNFASKENERLIGTKNSKGSKDFFQLIQNDPMYFNVAVPRSFQSATVSVRYQNPDNQSIIRLGVLQPNRAYAFADLVVTDPVLDALPDTWDKIQEGDVVLWQKNNELIKLQRQLDEKKKTQLAHLERKVQGQLQTYRARYQRGEIDKATFISAQDQLARDRDQGLVVIDRENTAKERPAPRFATMKDFLDSNPDQRLTLQYRYRLAQHYRLPGYMPAQTPTTIRTSLRGSHTIIVYLGDNEPLSFAFTLQNINRHEGKDSVVYKIDDGAKTVLSGAVSAFGSEDVSPLPSEEQTLHLQKEGLERGFYTITLTANDDVFIKSIVTKQHRFVFAKRLYLAENAEYQVVLGRGNFPASNVFTTGTSLAASTSHKGSLQTLTVGRVPLPLNTVHEEATLKGLKGVTKVAVPLNDVAMTTDGYFSLEQSQMINPDGLGYPELTSTKNLDHYDFIIASYRPPRIDGDWLVASATIRAPSLVLKDNVASFILQFPGLAENHRSMKIGTVTITFEKPRIPLLQIPQKILKKFHALFR